MEIMRYIILFSLVVFSFNSEGQISFYNKYSGGPFDQGNGVTQLPDSSYVVTGTSAGFNSESGQAFLMLTDSLGNQQWTKDYGGYGDDIGVRVIHIPNDGFFIAGYTGSTPNGDFDFVLYKTDENGDLLWEKTYGGSDWEKLNDAALLSDGGLILVGETEGLESQGRDMYMVRTDALGDTLWTKTVQTPEDDFINVVDTLSATEFLIGGNVGTVGVSMGVLTAYNNDGTEVWSESLNQGGVSTINDFSIYDDTIYLVGFLQNSVENKTDLWVAKCDLTGDFISQYYEEFYDLSTYFSSICVKNRDTMYMAMHTSTPEVNPYPGGLDLLVHRYKPSNLTFQASHPLTGYNDDLAQEMILASDNGVVVVGTVSDDPLSLSLGTDVLLAKIGPNDEAPNNSIGDLDLVNLFEETTEVVQVYPNPTNGLIYLPNELIGNQYELLNIQGKKVFSGQLEARLNLTDLDEGIYFLSIQDQQQIWSAKIIKR
ncbi:T9SS C-terminal target domain-containing protein [Brumimicrobium aurantiacum]|uniref:T9SS C-terminal target domain-containing protein n=2 Tax=Brumimicrobium aurantiacum TaxID=1737063 RepID=A0A3E1EYQ0_9FLAO|nr:T9SS C-terminal target domain-containing protein [Brumimicrobium aurantiacum]